MSALKLKTSIKPSQDCIEQIQKDLLTWGRSHYALFSWRTTSNRFHGLIAEVMLQRTKAEQVEPVFQEFINRYRLVGDAVNNKKRLLSILKPLGLEWRAKKIIELVQDLQKFGDEPPMKMEELMSLPGVGFYVASAYQSFHLNKRALIIDTNSVRLWSRIFGFSASGETRRKKWLVELVDSVTPKEEHKPFNYAVLDLTRTICKKRPLCLLCPLKELCYFAKK